LAEDEEDSRPQQRWSGSATPIIEGDPVEAWDENKLQEYIYSHYKKKKKKKKTLL
jgi:hypothetical protein